MAVELVSSGQSDLDAAQEFHGRIGKQLQSLAVLMDEVNRHGMRVEFQLGIDGFGRNVVARLEILKRLAP